MTMNATMRKRCLQGWTAGLAVILALAPAELSAQVVNRGVPKAPVGPVAGARPVGQGNMPALAQLKLVQQFKGNGVGPLGLVQQKDGKAGGQDQGGGGGGGGNGQNGQAGQQGESQNGQAGYQGEQQNGQAGQQGESQNGQNGEQSDQGDGKGNANAGPLGNIFAADQARPLMGAGLMNNRPGVAMNRPAIVNAGPLAQGGARNLVPPR